VSPHTPVRIPLQIGLSSLRSAVRASVFGWLSFGLTSSYFWLLPLVAPSGTGLGVGHAIAIPAGTLLGLLFLYPWSLARDVVHAEAPNDLELGPEGLRVLGGAAPGAWIAWADVDPDACEVVDDPAAARSGVLHVFATIVTFGLWRLVRRLRPAVQRLQVRTREGVEHVLARSDDRAEIASFRDVAETVRAIARDEQPAPADAPSAAGAHVLACHACAAPLAPADVAYVRCHHCEAETDVPDDLRARLRAPVELARMRKVERQLRRLTRRPGAWRARGVLRLARLTMWLAWPGFIAGWAMLYLHQVRDAPDGKLRVFLLSGAPSARAAAIAALDFAAVLVMPVVLAAATLHSRRALRVVSLRFGAVAPVEPGAPCTCRRCGAPLPEAAGHAAIACVYCGAENVLGDHLLPAARRIRGQAGALRDAFVHRRRARLRVAVALVAAVAAGWGVARTVEATRARLPYRQPFECGLASTCVELENLDPRAHALVVRTIDSYDKQAGPRQDVVIRAGERVAIECLWIGCAITLELARTERKIKRYERPLAIRDGALVPLDAAPARPR
jgi:hypothetical protein